LEKIKISTEYNLDNNYSKYKKIFLDFIQYYKDLINQFNKKMKDFEGKIYLF
jgi:hypothetical protein